MKCIPVKSTKEREKKIIPNFNQVLLFVRFKKYILLVSLESFVFFNVYVCVCV